MRFYRLGLVIAFTAPWAGIAVLVGGALEDKLMKIVGGGALIWLVVYALTWDHDGAAKKPMALLEYKPLTPFRLSTPEPASRNALTVTGQPPPVRPHALRTKIAVLLCAIWLLAGAVVAPGGGEIGPAYYLLVVVPYALLLFVSVDALGRMIEWVIADPSRAWRKFLTVLAFIGIALLWIVLMSLARGLKSLA